MSFAVILTIASVKSLEAFQATAKASAAAVDMITGTSSATRSVTSPSASAVTAHTPNGAGRGLANI